MHALLTLLPLLISSASAHFVLADSYIGRDFLYSWNWETLDDPTHGRVNFVDQQTALNNNLTYASNNKFVMRADFQNNVEPNSRGRNSVRIQSHKAYDESLIILDLQHMPEGCATWPAFWSLSQKGPWPHGGEVDIIEGVNRQVGNLASLHTLPNCNMPDQRFMSGMPTSDVCDTNYNSNQGCGVVFQQTSSYGAAFNDAGGGYYAVARTRAEGVRVWFWSRYDPTVPPEVRDPTRGGFPFGAPEAISPNGAWGVPDAFFPTWDNCGYDGHFNAHALVFDLTFCGDFAGSQYPSSGCPGDCVDYVNNSPWAFANAYWEVNSLHVFTPL